MRRAAKIDSNQNEIVRLLRRIPGISVHITSQMGKGYPDLNVGYKGKTYLIELKDGKKVPSARRLTPDEIEFKDGWKGHYAVAESLDDVLAIIQVK